MEKVMVTGAVGQIGSELIPVLRKRLGAEKVIAAGHIKKPEKTLLESGPFQFIDCTDINTIAEVVRRHNVDTIYHLGAVLSASGEKAPQLCWNVNVKGLYNVLEVARQYHCSVFTPSSIGTFGPATPKIMTPQDTLQRPDTIYGVSKVAGELLCDYYHRRFGVDTRGVRYPGLISYKTAPGGGTTDYAVEIYFEAVQHKKYTCYLKKGTFLDMMYMPDAINAAINLMEADPSCLKHRNSFNVTAMSVAPETIAAAIKKVIPEFELNFEIDPLRQAIADSWPDSIDDSAARKEWGWRPEYDLESMTKDVLKNIRVNLESK
jgi:nucleoside-diphosphate-sugar epimerase